MDDVGMYASDVTNTSNPHMHTLSHTHTHTHIHTYYTYTYVRDGGASDDDVDFV